MNEARTKHASSPPVLEWISGAIGLAIVIATLVFLGYRVLTEVDTPPALTAHVERIVSHPGGHVVLVVVRNGSRSTAAQVDIEATLRAQGREVARSTATLDYVPGNSQHRAGLSFHVDPRAYELEVRALGYAEP